MISGGGLKKEWQAIPVNFQVNFSEHYMENSNVNNNKYNFRD